jgi:hypothetical protein
MTAHKTVFDNSFKLEQSDILFNYQAHLTTNLDKLNKPFDQQVINEIVLWKVNRFVSLTDQTFELLNKIDSKSTNLDIDLTTKILKALLQTKGIRLPMASTILRFKNKNIYQIIDQRVFRIIYKDKKLNLYKSLNDKKLTDQVQLYLKYLTDLKTICGKLTIQFDIADRILFMADKRINRDIPLDNYSKKSDLKNEEKLG